MKERKEGRVSERRKEGRKWKGILSDFASEVSEKKKEQREGRR